LKAVVLTVRAGFFTDHWPGLVMGRRRTGSSIANGSTTKGGTPMAKKGKHSEKKEIKKERRDK
jgi:hypothetical protein